MDISKSNLLKHLHLFLLHGSKPYCFVLNISRVKLVEKRMVFLETCVGRTRNLRLYLN